MPKMNIQLLGRKLLKKRGDRGVREVAKEIGISSATLSRVERGYLPDITTFKKICEWLEIDPSKLLGIKQTAKAAPTAAVHFRKKQSIKDETAMALGKMILAAQRALSYAEGE